MVEAGTQDFRRCVLENTNCNTTKKCKHKMHEAGVGRPGTPMSFLVCQKVLKVEDWDTTLKDAEGEQVDSVRELETN